MNLSVRLALTVALAVTALPISARPPVPISHLAPGQQLKWESKKFIHVHELRPGMRGYALTVFKGTKISRYGIEILGIVEKFNAGKDYIMFRVTDGPPVTKGLGIAHGMSGSPIYIGGRLAGAIAYGNQFAKDPIGFATPIEDMFDAWSPDLPSKIPSISASAPMPGMAQEAEASGQHNMPLMVSGMDARGLARLSAALSPDHFTVMAGSAGSSDGTNPLALGPTLVPGSAVGVSLVQGDMDASATGTVTYRDGNRLLLFGHPFQNLGPIDAALTTAYVVDIFPSYQSGELIGSPIKTVGRIFQDRPFSVGGVIGPMPQMIPMTVAVNDQSIHRQKNFHVRIINHPLLTGQFITGIADAAIAQVHGDPGDSMATVSMDVDVEEIGHVKRINTFYDPLSIDQSAVEDLDSLMHLLSSNPYYPLAVRSVKMEVTIQNKHDTAEIDHLFIKQTKFAPGDTVNVGVVLKPYKRELLTQMIAVKIPASAPDGPLSLNIRGGTAEGGGMTSLLGGLIQVRASEPAGAAANIAQLVRQFTEKPRNNALVAHLQLPTSAIDIKGEKLSNLPPTLGSVIQSTRSTGLHTERDEVKVITPSSYIISGSQSLTITVSKKDVAEPTNVSAPAVAAPASTSPAMVLTEVASADVSDPEARLTGLTAVIQATLPAPPHITSPSGSPELGRGGDLVPGTPSGAVAPELGQGGDIPSLKTVGRQASTWQQNTAAEFAAGTLKNVSVTSLGDVRLSAALQKVADTSATYLWALLPDGKGNLYLGTGDGGVIYKMDAGGKVAPFFRTNQLEVTSLAQDDAGNLYAGTAPHGIVFKVTPAGQGRELYTAAEKYVTALVCSNSHLYIATGGGVGSVYKLDTSGVILPHSPLFTSPEAHILSLAIGADGTVYAGSSPDGIVYKIDVNGGAHILADLNEPNVSALATDSQGNVYAGTLPQGNVYKIAPDGTSRRLFHAAAGIAALRSDSNDTLYACAGSTVYRINPDETIQSYVAGADEQFLSLAVDPSENAIYTGTGTVASVYKLGAAGANGLQGLYQSPVHDSGLPARWGTLTWMADTPPGTQVTLQTRSGDIERPDSSWSDWSTPYTIALGQTISSPPARYLQYQAVLTSNSSAQTAGNTPKLSAVTVYYLPRNQSPSVSIVKPTGGAALAKATLLQWTAHDPDKDTLTYELSYSGDSGKTWHPITKRAKPDTSMSVTPAAPKQSALSETQANLALHPGIPAAIRAQILAQASAPITSVNAASPLKQTSFSWDTTEVPDGVYMFRVIASDKVSNPLGALTGKATSAPFLIANTAPQLILGLPNVADDRIITLRGSVQTGQAFVKAVQGKIDGGEPQAAAADDGLFDSTSEPFTLTLPASSTGTHSVEVQAEDQAGNVVTRTVRVTVP